MSKSLEERMDRILSWCENRLGDVTQTGRPVKLGQEDLENLYMVLTDAYEALQAAQDRDYYRE